MKKKSTDKTIRSSTVTAFIIAVGVGFLFHFLYDVSGKNSFVALIAPVNESIWEHLKLLAMPYLLTAGVEFYIYGRHTHNFFCAKFIGILTSLFFVVSSYYTIAGAIGVNTMATNIVIFILGTFIAYLTSYRILKKKRIGGGIWESVSIVCLAILVLSFFILTFWQPHLPLFRDPTNMSYGAI